MKKFVTMLLALVLVFACTMTSFAAEEKTEEQKKAEEVQQKILDELKDYGITVDAGVEAAVKSLEDWEYERVLFLKDSLREMANQAQSEVLAAAAKKDVEAIAKTLNDIAYTLTGPLGFPFEVSEIKAEDITINADGTVTAKVGISYMGGSTTITISNAKAATNPLGQKTGDNGLVIVLAGLAVVSAVLVAGMRKSRAMAL